MLDSLAQMSKRLSPKPLGDLEIELWATETPKERGVWRSFSRA